MKGGVGVETVGSTVQVCLLVFHSHFNPVFQIISFLSSKRKNMLYTAFEKNVSMRRFAKPWSKLISNEGLRLAFPWNFSGFVFAD